MARKKSHKKAEKPEKKAGRKKRGVRISEIPGEVNIERSPFRLKGKIRYLSTDIDVLRSYVLEKKKVKLSTVAKKFDVPEKIAEDWGKILEDHQMIDMHYPVAGEPVLKVHVPKGKEAKKPPNKKGKPGVNKLSVISKLLRTRLSKKKILIIAELIVLCEILIYIFIVNPHLRNNLVPTLNYQLGNLPANIMNIPNYFSGSNLPINPIYFAIGIIIVVFWIAAAALHKRKKKASAKKQEKKHKSRIKHR